jgi:flagellar motor protein MotB
MAVISLGSSEPVVDNKTRDNRAQNRRIEILVYGQV